MSWEEFSRESHPCPCGDGEYVVILKMDDWNRTDQEWTMNCPSCKANYSLISKSVTPKGLSSTEYRWVESKMLQHSRKCIADADSLKERVREILRGRYLETWLDYFQSKSKKDIWSELTDNGDRYPALNTFYSQTKGKQLTPYLESHLLNNPVPSLSLIGREDAEITELLSRSECLIEESENVLKET